MPVITSVVNTPSDQIVTTPSTAKTLTVGNLVKASTGNTLLSVGVTTVIDTYTILSTDDTVVCNKLTDFTVTLPTGVVGHKINIKNIGDGTITVSLAGDTIDGEASQLVYTDDCMQIQCAAANEWRIL